MEVNEFNDFELKAGDIIDITYNNGSIERRLLLRGTAVPPVPEKRTYPDNQVVPAIPAKIIVQNGDTGHEEGIELETIRQVQFIKNMNR